MTETTVTTAIIAMTEIKSNVPNKSNVANSNNKGGEDRGC